MARSVLLIEPDVDELGVLASKLRARGLEVWLADGVEGALLRARKGLPDVVLISEALEPGSEAAFAAVPGLLSLPSFRLAEAPAGDSRALPRRDAEAVARRVLALPARAPSIAPEASDFRGDLAQVSVVDLIQLLGANRRSGALTLQTPLGTGEIRFSDGEVSDALYRRLEGKKALFRLLNEREGTFSFVGGAGSAYLRRIDEPMNALLMDGVRELDEARELSASLALAEEALIALTPPEPDATDVDSMILGMLVTPRTLAELLDDVPSLDLEVLRRVAALMASGAVRPLPGGMRRVELADAERLGVLAALSKRIARPGFREGARVALAGSPRRLLSMMAALGRVADAMMPSEAVPTAPIPHVLATLRLGDSVDLDLLGLPLVEAYAPLWGLVLPGCSGLALLETEPRTLLEGACQVASVPVFDAVDLLEGRDETDPELVAVLVQRVLESAAGA